jgi:tripartite-type tricarboxylate transporter receptor subunit TctC
LIDALNAGLKKGIASPDIQKLFDAQGAEPIASSPEAFSAFLREESARFAAIIRGAGISAD